MLNMGCHLSSAEPAACANLPKGEDAGKVYVQMPQLSDRCGGSRDDAQLIPVPEGVELPAGVTPVRLDD